MKKLSIVLLCCVMLLSCGLILSGCKEEADKYEKLKEVLLEQQIKYKDNLYNNYIYITGKGRTLSSGTSHIHTDHSVRLEDVVITYNAIIAGLYEYDYYYLFIDIQSIKDMNKKVIWSA